MSKHFKWILIYSILPLFIFSCSSDSDQGNPAPLEAETYLNVAYGEHPQQTYDLYLPAGRATLKTKVIVLIHGGGWTSGDKTDMENFVQLLKENHPNHAIVNMNYVLATTTISAFPSQFFDIEKVINKIANEKNTLQILDEFGLIGSSAGAHLALQYDYVYDTMNRIKMVGDIVGPTDFTDPFYADDPNFQVALNLLVDEDAYPKGTNYAEVISPALQVNENSSPSILFYGETDPIVPLSNGQRLQLALSNAQISHSFTVYEGGHGDDWSLANTLDLQMQLSEFIATYLNVE